MPPKQSSTKAKGPTRADYGGSDGEEDLGTFDPNLKPGDMMNVVKLQDENASLKKAAKEKDQEIEEMTEALVTLQEELKASEHVSGAGVSKDLLKKNREIQRLLAQERGTTQVVRNECDKLKIEITRLQDEIRHLTGTAVGAGNGSPRLNGKGGLAALGIGGKLTLAEEFEDCKRKLHAEIAKSEHVHQQMYNLKKEKREIAMALQREVGEDRKLEDVLAQVASKDWRGRSEQIFLLKKKNKELQEQLKRINGGQDDNFDMRGSPNGGQEVVLGTQRDDELKKLDADKRAIKKMEELRKQKNQEWDKLNQAYDEVCQKYNRQTDVIKSNKSRVATLNDQLNDLREKAKLLIMKSDSDDGLVEGLRNELKEQHLKLEKLGNKLQSLTSSSKQDNKLQLLNTELMMHKQRADQTIAEQGSDLASLRKEVGELRLERSKFVQQQVEQWDVQGYQQQLHYYQIEDQKKKDLLDMHNTRIQQVEAALAQQIQNYAKLQSKLQAMEKRVEKRQDIKSAVSRELPMVEQIEMLAAEKKMIENSYGEALHRKDVELRQTQGLLSEHKIFHQKTVESLKQKIAMIEENVRLGQAGF